MWGYIYIDLFQLSGLIDNFCSHTEIISEIYVNNVTRPGAVQQPIKVLLVALPYVVLH